MGKFKFLCSVMILVMSALFIGNAVAIGIGVPDAALPIAAVIGAAGLIPLQETNILALNAINILYPQGRFNPGGVQGKVYYAFEEDLASWPDALVDVDTETAESYESLVTVSAADPFVFKEGKGWKELYVTLETGELRYSLIGPRDSKAFQNFMEVSYPSNAAQIIGFIAATANRRMVFAVPEQNKRVKILGTPQYPAQLDTAEGTTGKLIEDGNVLISTYSSKSPMPAAVYLPPIAVLEDA